MPNPTEYTLPYFGEIDLTDPDDSYSVEIEFHGREVQLDLDFDGESPSIEKLASVKRFLEQLPEQDQRNKAYMREDYESINDEDDSLKFYINMHLDEIGEEQLVKILGIDDDDLPIEEQLLDKIGLVRIGFYPNEDAYFAICDYTFGREITNYVVVMELDEEGGLQHMTTES